MSDKHQLVPVDIEGTIKCLVCNDNLTDDEKKRNGPCPGPKKSKGKSGK